MPSPAMATTRPSAWSRLTLRPPSGPGRTSAMTSSMPSLLRDGRGRRAAVAGEHDDPNPFGVEQRESPRRVLSLIGSATPTRPAGSTVDRHEHHGLALATQRLGAFGERTQVRRRGSPSARGCRAPRPARRRVPSRLCPSSTRSLRPPRAWAPRASRRRRSPPPAGVRSRARGSPRGAASVALVDAFGGGDAHEPRLALGQRAGLVDDQRVDLAQHLDRLGVLEEDAHRRALARSRP